MTSATPPESSLSAEWLVETGDEAHWLALHGRVADLLVLGRPWDGGTIPMDVVDAALMDTGRPVLIVPTRPPDQIGQTIVIAWKDTAEAASAVAAAMPLLVRARQVVILSVEEDAKTDASACERLRKALVWHNRSIAVRCLPAADGDPADTLLRTAAKLGADMLVMGGYGHNRMREVVYGGGHSAYVARSRFAGADGPLIGTTLDFFHWHRRPEGRRTIVTESHGAMRGHRVVRGREAECQAWHGTVPREGEPSGGSRDAPEVAISD